MTNDFPIEFAKNLDGLTGIRHGFFTRNGGVSSGIYASLNPGLGSDDTRVDVLENRRRIAACFERDSHHLLSVHQYHSRDVVTAEGPWINSPKADAIVTKAPGLMISVMSADCSPVLFYDPNAKIIAAAHAGWRGALGGVCEQTLATMISLGAQAGNVRAAIGPCLGSCHFEVGPEFVDAFLTDDSNNQSLFRPGKKDRSYFDIKSYLRRKLLGFGIESVSVHPQCTYAMPERYFSYRYNTHRGISDYGRNISAIMLNP